MPEKLWKSTIAGGAGGAALVIVGHPLDTIKVKLQTMEIKAGEKPMYAGTMDCAQQTLRREGVRGLYRGMTSPLSGVVPMYALCFYGYGVGKKIFCDETSFRDLKLHHIAAAGATSAVFTTPILAPLERVKCVMQMRGVPDSPLRLGREMLATGGIASLNRGFWATMLRDGVASCFYFSTYEVLKKTFTPAEGRISDGGLLVAGGMAGIFNWLGCLPIDTLKSKLQIAPEGKYPNGIRSVFAEVMRTDGFMSLYRGFTPVMLRAFPANAACFYAFEYARRGLDTLFPDELD